MKHSFLNRVLFLSVFALLASGCVVSGDVWKATKDEDQISSSNAIYQSLNINYQADTDQLSVLAQFRNGGAYQESIELSNGVSVMVDAQPLTFNYVSPHSGATTGSYYTKTMAHPWDLSRAYEFSWQTMQGQMYRNRVRLPSRFGVSASIQTIHRADAYLMVSYVGADLGAGESVTLDITGDYGTTLRAATFTPFSRTIAIDLSRILDPSHRYDSSVIKIAPSKRLTGSLSDSTLAGGEFTTTYQAETLTVYVQP
ncbi:hypothetical protein BH10BDE1_BH10BDE1_09440 [soil metagenome]